MDTLLEHLFTQVSLKASKKGLTFRIEIGEATPLVLIGLPTHILEVLTHLTDNAIKFTETGEIVVQVGVWNESETPEDARISEGEPMPVVLQFCVRDTGIGISSAKISELFEVFTQEDGRARAGTREPD
ncbi:sensory box sensor histidine kinase/response regulator [Candidatus Vecturithrix granuli]|uniref:histidine kinase n=1 Tax=Vecturithrix granuli TaxID=1499967 RepID=A0A081C9V5_VECG1|nr:sensory box sensor histidine kinase/response regulator [Candidatus Vecturithrix granuli]